MVADLVTRGSNDDKKLRHLETLTAAGEYESSQRRGSLSNRRRKSNVAQKRMAGKRTKYVRRQLFFVVEGTSVSLRDDERQRHNRASDLRDERQVIQLHWVHIAMKHT